jgi:hypothetical protein
MDRPQFSQFIIILTLLHLRKDINYVIVSKYPNPLIIKNQELEVYK